MATNGYSPTGFGAANKGLAGAGVAFPQDTLAGATNPAGMVDVGNRIDIGIGLFNPNRGFTADDNAAAPPPPPGVPAGTYESRNDWFPVPHAGWNRRLDARRSIGVLLGANGGMNTEYGTDVWRNFNSGENIASSPTGVDLAQLFVGVPYAFKVGDRHAFGIMPIVAAQRFKAEGLQPFQALSANPTKVSNNGYDYSWGYGIRVGWLGQLSDDLALGVSAQSRLHMTEFDDYAGLFAEQGDFDVPPTVAAGIRYDVTPAVTVVADWQRIFYSEVAALNNSNDLVLAPPDNLLGADQGLGFGWGDIDIFKLGVQWQYRPGLVLRAGVSHADQLFANGESLFNVLAPATVRTHASLGLSYEMDGGTLSLAYTRAFDEKIEGQNPNFTGPQTGSVQMDQHELEVSWAWTFD
jgi:long-chain fatty acid transport protein